MTHLASLTDFKPPGAENRHLRKPDRQDLIKLLQPNPLLLPFLPNAKFRQMNLSVSRQSRGAIVLSKDWPLKRTSNCGSRERIRGP